MLPPQRLNHPAPLTDIHCSPTHKYIPPLTPSFLCQQLPPSSLSPWEPSWPLQPIAKQLQEGGQRCELIHHSPEGAIRLGSILQISRSRQLRGRAQEKLPHPFLWICMNSPSLPPQILRIPVLGRFWGMPTRRKLQWLLQERTVHQKHG